MLTTAHRVEVISIDVALEFIRVVGSKGRIVESYRDGYVAARVIKTVVVSHRDFDIPSPHPPSFSKSTQEFK